MLRSFRAPLLRAAIASLASLCLFLVQTAPTAATTLAAPAPGTTLSRLKPGTQFNAEAARYDAAIKAMAGIATAQISTAKDLEAAASILRRYAPDLKFATSRLVTLAYADRAFTAAIARYFVNEQFARDFARKIASDHTMILRLDGAKALMVKMTETLNANAAIMRKVEQNLRAAQLRITGKAPARAPAVAAAIAATQWATITTAVLIAATVSFASLVTGATVAGSTVTVAATAAFAAIIPTLVYSSIPQGLSLTLASFAQAAAGAVEVVERDADAIAACVEAAVERNEQCLVDAAALPPQDRLQAQLTCAAYLAAEQAICSMMPTLQ